MVSHPTKKGAIDRAGRLVRVFNERRPRDGPFILPLKGRRSEGQWRGEGAAKQVAGRVHSVSSESQNCSELLLNKSLSDGREAQPDLCLPSFSQSAHFRVSPDFHLTVPPPFSSLIFSKLLLSFLLCDVHSPQRSSTKPPLFIGSRWTRLTVVL